MCQLAWHLEEDDLTQEAYLHLHLALVYRTCSIVTPYHEQEAHIWSTTYLAQGFHDGRSMCRAHVAGQTMQGHVHEGLQGARPLLRDLGDLLAPQERLAWGQHVHSLVQRLANYRPMTGLFLWEAHRHGWSVTNGISMATIDEEHYMQNCGLLGLAC